jgi:phosphatidate cytidylyltransferase
MLKRILTGIVAFCFILVPVLFFADTVVLPIAVSLFGAVAAYEILHCVGLHKNLWVSIPLYLVSAAMPFCLRYPSMLSLVSLFLAVWVLLIYLPSTAVLSHGKTDIRDVSAAFLLWQYALMGFAGLVLIHDFIRGGEYLYLLAFIGAWVTDTFAYFTGMLFGKHKLIPDVSPKKTVEGAIGGTVFCVLAFIGYAFLYNRFWAGEGPLSVGAMAIVGLLVAVVSQLGDLCLSLLKRKYGIKDFGKIFPGHGGVMDRFDSVLAVSIILAASFILLTVLGLHGVIVE